MFQDRGSGKKHLAYGIGGTHKAPKGARKSIQGKGRRVTGVKRY
jgi:hypothetical protein